MSHSNGGRFSLSLVCLLVVFLKTFLAVEGGLQLHRQVEEKLYTNNDISKHNRDTRSKFCLCIGSKDDIVRSVFQTTDESGDGIIVPSCTDVCSRAENKTCEDTKEHAGRIIRLRMGSFWPIFVPDAAGNRNSFHLLDPFTVTHVSHGILVFAIWTSFYTLVPKSFSLNIIPWWYAGGIIGGVLEAAWEIGENAPFMIKRFRAGGLSRDYYGDAVINSFGDWAAAIFGYFICVWLCAKKRYAAKNVIYASILMFVLSEVALTIYQHDCMVLIWMQLIWNPRWLIDFQNKKTFADMVLEK